MAKNASFDITTGVDLQEVDNAVNQATKEIGQRYDFKNSDCTIRFDRAGGSIELDADDGYRLEALKTTVREKLAKRGVPLQNLDEGKVEEGTLGRHRQTLGLKQGLDQETAKQISKAIKEGGFKKVQVQIQKDEIRVTAPARDTLQEVIVLLRAGDYGVALNFGNYR